MKTPHDFLTDLALGSERVFTPSPRAQRTPIKWAVLKLASRARGVSYADIKRLFGPRWETATTALYTLHRQRYLERREWVLIDGQHHNLGFGFYILTPNGKFELEWFRLQEAKVAAVRTAPPVKLAPGHWLPRRIIEE